MASQNDSFYTTCSICKQGAIESLSLIWCGDCDQKMKRRGTSYADEQTLQILMKLFDETNAFVAVQRFNKIFKEHTECASSNAEKVRQATQMAKMSSHMSPCQKEALEAKYADYVSQGEIKSDQRNLYFCGCNKKWENERAGIKLFSCTICLQNTLEPSQEAIEAREEDARQREQQFIAHKQASAESFAAGNSSGKTWASLLKK